MKRLLQISLVSLMLIAVISGCSNSTTKPADSTLKAEDPTKEGTSITLWTNFQV